MTMNRLLGFLAMLAVALLLVASSRSARAGSTDPVLVIGQATSKGSSPLRLVELLGSWGFDDVLQIEYPLNIVVSQGERFVRYRVGGEVESGSFAGIGDGLSPGEIATLEQSGEPATASIERLARHEMTLSLPQDFADGALRVVLYVSLPGEGIFLSNSATTGAAS